MKERGLCINCKTKVQMNKGKNWGYRSTCKGCYQYKLNIEKKVCQRCGFVAENPCQLDIHHLDGNHLNNISENLFVLCANCHRLEHCKISPSNSRRVVHPLDGGPDPL